MHYSTKVNAELSWKSFPYFLHFDELIGQQKPQFIKTGFIAIAGVAVEIGVIMLVYLNQAWHYIKLDAKEQSKSLDEEDLSNSIREGAGLRVRPVMMTVLTVIIGLIPIMYGEGTGSEVMQRIAAPMIGGMASALLLTLLVLPAIFKLWKTRELKHN